MKLERILKISGAVVLTGFIIYKISEEYVVRKIERDVDKYMNSIREAGL